MCENRQLFPNILAVSARSIRQTGSHLDRAPHATMSTQPPEQPSMIERIERAMVLLAYFIELDGDVHVPMFEKFEAELKELRQTEDVKSRARRLLALHGMSGELQAVGRTGAAALIAHPVP